MKGGFRLFEKMKSKMTRFVPALFAMVMMMSMTAFATGETGTPVAADAWKPVIDALTAQISVSTVVAALATFVTAGIGLVFMWWGLRKGLRSLMSAFRKGRMSV